MALPKQVQQQMADLDALEKQLSAPPEETKPGENTEQEGAVTPSEPEVVPKPPVVDEGTWEHKYKVLSGKYDAEVPRLHASVKDLGTKLADALDEIGRLKAAASAATAQATVETAVTDKDVEIFGKDLIDLQRRIAGEVSAKFETQLNELKSRNDALQAQLEQTGNKVTTMTFEQRLARDIPDFDEINDDPNWVAWLDEYDPLLRTQRRVVAQEAFNNGDVDALVDYVNVFRSTTQPPKVKTKQSELERQIVPSRTSAPTAAVTPKGKMYTAAQVDGLFSKIRQLNIQGKFDEATKLDAEITAAYAEGRVVG